MNEAERYLTKARESLTSAEADLAAGRYNSVANRAYYAAFQATVAALVQMGVHARGNDWSHRFVMDRFSVTLVKRRKLLPSRYKGVLDDLFDVRVNADYATVNVSRRLARLGAKTAREIVDAVEEFTGSRRVSEKEAEYVSREKTSAREYRKKAAGFIQEIKDTILSAYPDSTFELYERTPKDYRMIVRGSFEDQLDIQDLLDGRKSDILVEHDIWIVLLAHPREEQAA